MYRLEWTIQHYSFEMNITLGNSEKPGMDLGVQWLDPLLSTCFLRKRPERIRKLRHEDMRI